ncbi:MAG: 1-deoxy-D-xylulose-5-phosphate synthase [Pseudomonadota bacterium]
MYKFLDNIQGPESIKNFDETQLYCLADEIRQKILSTCSHNGGHLAPSLGAVEISIALHYIFNSPIDSIVWDVGHQSYPHKLLTGRVSKFETVRKLNGLSGFTKISESKHDAFGAGHASTSISAAMGIATAKQLSNDPSKTIAVIGDGSMTGGLALAALNQNEIMKKNLCVVLNDNEMSISKNVSAIASFLSRKSTSKQMYNLQNDIKSWLSTFPSVGQNVINLISKTKEIVKSIITPGMLFETLGFRYIGPIDGHNLEELLEAFSNVKHLDEPVLIHCLTRKGKGYKPAEDDPERFHGIGPFDPLKSSANNESSRVSYTEVFGDTMLELGAKDSKIVAITAAMSPGTGLCKFKKKYADRFFDVGICEENAVIFAAGLAKMGYKPVVAIYSSFLQRGYDQIIHDVALQNLPVIFAIDRAGIVGNDGPTHHGNFDISFLRHIPNLVIMAPKDENELVNMLHTAASLNKPVAIRYPRGHGVGARLDKEKCILELGKNEIIRSETSKNKVLILACGNTVWPANEAASKLEKDGIKSDLINCRFIKPFDTELLIKLSKNCKAIVTVEENVLAGGFGSSVLEVINDLNIPSKPLLRIGVKDEFVCQGSQAELREIYEIDAQGIYKRTKSFWNSLYPEKQQLHKTKVKTNQQSL